MTTITTLHLGAGRQSTAISLLIHNGLLPRPDYALFADTGSEPAEVYTHLERIRTELLEPTGVPLRLVQRGNLADDVRDPHVYAKIPAYTLELTPKRRGFVSWDERREGMIQRQCTGRYKVEPLERETRQLLGATVRHKDCRYCEATGVRLAPWDLEAGPGPCSVCRGAGARILVGSVPKGAVAEAWIGFDALEAALRINETSFPAYMRPAYPLLTLPRLPGWIADDQRRRPNRPAREVGWDIGDCLRYLQQHGWTDVPKSSCFMCPYTSNARWRKIRRENPELWQRAVDYDRAIRTGSGLRAQRFLHEQRVPLDEANIDRRTAAENLRDQVDLFDALADQEDEDAGGCSPWGCHSGAPKVAA